MFVASRVRALVVLLFLSACQGGQPPTTSLNDPRSETRSEKALVDYLRNLSPIVEGASIETASLEQYRIPTSSGAELDAWIRRPPGNEPQPLVLFITPYYGGGSPDFPGNALGDPSRTLAEYLIPYGYAVGLLSVGGTGNSGGCFHNGGPIERQQLKEAVAFLGQQSWSNAAVAAMGVSYDGTTAIELFVDPPEELKAVIPIEAISDYYRYSFVNGMIRENTPFFTTYYYAIVGLGPVGLSGGVGPSSPADFAVQLSGELCPEQLAYQQESLIAGITGNRSAYWDERDAIALLQQDPLRPRPAMFYIQGYQDANVDPQMTDGFIEAVKNTAAPWHVWMGQWVHTYPQPRSSDCQALAPCRGDFFEQALLAWLDQFLKGRDTGILDAPAVQTQADDGRWRHQDDWPPATSQMQNWHLHADGQLNQQPSDGVISYTDRAGARPEELRDVDSNLGPIADAFPFIAGTRIAFVSAPLPQTLRLTGVPQIRSRVTSDSNRANFTATLFAQNPAGERRYLNYALQSLNHVDDPSAADSDISGQELEFVLNFYPQDNIIEAGWQLVIEIAGDIPSADIPTGADGSNFLTTGPSALPLGVGANVSLDLSRTELLLPVNPSDRLEPLSWGDS